MRTNAGVIGDIQESTKIYRIFPRDRFLQLFKENLNALVLPSKWQDPFENMFLKAEVVTATGERGGFGFHNDVYGQCWTLETASDAMWQIYSRENDAVRVRTTVGKLLGSLRAIHGIWAAETCFIGRVKYLNEKQLITFGETVFKDGLSGEAIAISLLAKRTAYKHENEVRLIYLERMATHHTGGIYKYELDPRTIVDQIMVDGRTTYEDFAPFREEVSRLTGLPNEKIKRSLLYTPPRGFVIHLR